MEMGHTHKMVLHNRRYANVSNHKNVINLIVIRKIKVKIIMSCGFCLPMRLAMVWCQLDTGNIWEHSVKHMVV